LSGSCSSNIGNAVVGNTINWTAYATGGNGVYTYSWNDYADGYSSVGQYLSRYYTSVGQKTMNITITSNGQSITRSCSVYVSANIINPVYNPIYTPPVYQNPAPIQNQVLGTNVNSPTVAAVYLSDVPYTGFEDYLKPLLFTLSLILWSSIMAFKFMKDYLAEEN